MRILGVFSALWHALPYLVGGLAQAWSDKA